MNKKYFSEVNYSRKNFKIVMIIVVFCLILARITILFYLPTKIIISDKILQFLMLLIISYLWIRELKDRNRLLQLHNELKQNQINTIATLIKIVEAKDSYTSGHSERVTKVALAIAEEMKLSIKIIDLIARSALLHDIGKIGISDSILQKKEDLSKEEWDIIKAHPQGAISILQPLQFLTEEINVILHHHEHYDGTGYPSGLKGKEIPLGALIIAVADTFDAMNSKRAYRDTLQREYIKEELKNCRGTQHAPEITDLFLELLNKNQQLWGR